MRGKTLVALALAAAVAAAFFVPGTATAAKKPAGPVVVGTDPGDDWGANVDPTISPAGAALASELTEASITMAGPSTINFIIKLASLPPSGGIPEGIRYTWDFNVDGKQVIELDGKFTNYSRGACDPTNGQCDPTTSHMPRDPGLQPFLVRGTCAPNATVSNLIVCEELGVVQATFDSAAGTITIPVPLAMIKAKPGSKIAPAMNSSYGTSVNVIPAAFVSSGNLPFDSLLQTVTYTIPKK
jgi:hypothetical protein